MDIRIVTPLETGICEQAGNFTGFSIYHTRCWLSFLQTTFGWQAKALIGYEGGKLAFYLPFVSKQRLFSRVNISLPLSHQVELAYDPGLFMPGQSDQYSLAELVKGLEVHGDIGFQGQRKSTNFITSIDLTRFGTEDQLLHCLEYSIRKRIKEAERANVKIVCGMNDAVLDDFYALEVETRHRQGSPVYPKTFFKNMRAAFEGTETLSGYIGYVDDRPAAGSIFFHHRGITVYGYSVSTSQKEILRTGVNQLVTWRGIQESYARGSRLFDYGSTSHTLPTLLSYKEKWCGTSVQLYYTYYGSQITKGGVKRDSVAVRLASRLFHIMPRGWFALLSPLVLRWVV